MGAIGWFMGQNTRTVADLVRLLCQVRRQIAQFLQFWLVFPGVACLFDITRAAECLIPLADNASKTQERTESTIVLR